MSRISSCASCHGDIMIPGFAQPQDQMRCPLCNALFSVRDVLATSILAPPEAIRVEQSAPLITAPLVTAASGPRLSHVEEPADLAAEIDSAPPRPRKKQPGVLSHLVGIIGGGVIGLSLGYLGLLKIGGPRYDFLEIGDRLPAWATEPISLDFLKGQRDGGDEPRNERSLKKLLDESNEPAAVDMPVAPDQPGAMPEAPPFPPSPFDAAPPLPAAPIPEQSEPAPPFTPSPVPPDLAVPPLPSEAATSTLPMSASPTNGPTTSAPPPAVRVGPVHFTPYSAEDLTLAVAEVTAAFKCPACNGTGYVTRAAPIGARDVKGVKVQQTGARRLPCETCGGGPVAKMTPELYAKLCHLAEVVTFVSKGDANTWSQRDAVQTLLVSAAADQHVAETIGRLGGFQLDQLRHKDHGNGIALAGTVQEMNQVGGLYAMRIVLFGLPKVVTVVSWRPAQPAINEHDRVIILGSIVDDPVENLAGYEGRLPQVVWGGLPAKLPPQP